MCSHLPGVAPRQSRAVKMLLKKKSVLPHQPSEVPDWLLVLEAVLSPGAQPSSEELKAHLYLEAETARAHLTQPPDSKKRN